MPSRRALLWAGPALDDLREIRAYIARSEPAAARRIADGIRRQVLLLRDNPLAGRIALDLDPRGYRELVVSPYRIIYTVEPRRVVVLRVWHGRRKLGGRDAQR